MFGNGIIYNYNVYIIGTMIMVFHQFVVVIQLENLQKFYINECDELQKYSFNNLKRLNSNIHKIDISW